ncbi:DNA oxidative demethylase AlkB [Pseudomonas cavernicola]|uniref:DNA oxidative demethylase AlkB n=1 Tax=Pseudomonas cavernicola TaxID=2320866 RepID=A0A418XE39_9PSED|nr:DNA oxidative demethylase AlkB [Pseudomonas cavernicola]RJG10603.1 DNA oxidative demethylase AlkB [Pseudomonas cavernicola]
MTMDLFDGASTLESQEQLAPGAVLLRGFAAADERELLSALAEVITQAPFRHMRTPGGLPMSVGMSNCGALGWISDRAGYRYGPVDPLSSQPWPPLPEVFLQLATHAAERAGFSRFVPDACLINRYEPGSRLSLHQDKNERDFGQPIVSVSLGLPVVFLFGGLSRSVPARRIGLMHGDVVVWGGPARLSYHGVLPLKEGFHPLVGSQRPNLTFRKAG